jgi:hypothetical protein
LTKPTATYLGDTYRFQWEQEGIEIVLDRIAEDGKAGPKGELTISLARPGMNGHLHGPTRFNLTAATTRAQLVKTMNERLPDVAWYDIFEQLCHHSLKRWRDGNPILDLTCIAPRERPRFVVEPFIEEGGVSILFADGNTGKSTLALALGASVATGRSILSVTPNVHCPVLYLDWEADPESHAERLRAIAGDDIAPDMMHYRREVASLAEGAPTLRRRIGELGIGLVIIDSLGAARGGEPENADTTIRMFNAIRSLEIPALCIDHVAKNAIDKNKPFGSVYSYNLARLVWRMDKTQQEDDEHSTVALTNTKNNNGKVHRQRGFKVSFSNDELGRVTAIEYDPCDVRDVPEFVSKLTEREQIISVLQANRQPMTASEITLALEADGSRIPDSHVRPVLNRYLGKNFVRFQGEGRELVWALMAHQ